MLSATFNWRLNTRGWWKMEWIFDVLKNYGVCLCTSNHTRQAGLPSNVDSRLFAWIHTTLSWPTLIPQGPLYVVRFREIKHVSFTPIVLSATGGLAHEASAFYKRLASPLSTKWVMSILLSWVGFVTVLAFLCFALLYSASKVHVLPLEITLGPLLQWI